ncbi:MAG: TolC family protein [Micropepsaceae bacterium]
MQELLGAVRAGLRVVFGALVCVGLPLLFSHAARSETLEEALVKTYTTNPDLAAERAAVRATDEQVSKARAKWRPSLNAVADYELSSESEKKGATHYDSRSRSWSADLVAKQPLFTGGRNGAARRIADANVQAARARLRGKEQHILLEAASAFATVVRNEAILDLVRGDIVLLQDLLKEIGARQDTGKATDSDVDQVQASLEAARAVCIAHDAALQNSWRSYEQVVGEPPVIVSPAGDAANVSPCVDARGARRKSALVMPEKLPRVPAALDEVEQAAQGNLPQLDAARAEEEASRGDVSAAYAELLPHAGLTASIGTSGEEVDPQSLSREATVSATLRIPLFNTGAEWSEIRAARERANQARLEITSAQRRAMRDAYAAWYDLVSVRAVRAVSKVQAQTVLRAFQGLRKEMADPKLHRSVTDLLGLRQVYLATQIALMDSNKGEAVSVFRLLAATGKLNAKELNLPVEIYEAETNLKRPPQSTGGARGSNGTSF